MSNSEASKILVSLSKTDAEIQVTNQRKNEVQERRVGVEREILRLKAEIGETETRHATLKTRQELEEERFKNEEKKIVERRKQLSALGGTKGAKLVEREIDIAARTLQTMEQRALSSVEEAEALGKKAEELKAELDKRQLELETNISADEQVLSEINARLTNLTERRQQSISGLDERVRSLYTRVSSRYPGGAIAIAENGACRSCFRSLPAQLFNQVLSGNLLLQCPGCSRILVTGTVEQEEAGQQ